MRASLVVLGTFLLLIGVGRSVQAAPLIYVTESDGANLGTVDAADATGTDIGSSGYSETYGAAFDNSTGQLFAIVDALTSPTLGTFDLDSGTVTTIGSGLGSIGAAMAIEISDDGTIYVAGFDQRLWTVDRSTGSASLVGKMGSEAVDITDMAFDPTTGKLWGTAYGSLFTIDPSTAETTSVSTITGLDVAAGLTFGRDGTMYVIEYTSTGDLYTVDPSSGDPTLVGATDLDHPLGMDIIVPEPSSFLLLGIGALALLAVGVRRRRRRLRPVDRPLP